MSVDQRCLVPEAGRHNRPTDRPAGMEYLRSPPLSPGPPPPLSRSHLVLLVNFRW